MRDHRQLAPAVRVEPQIAVVVAALARTTMAPNMRAATAVLVESLFVTRTLIRWPHQRPDRQLLRPLAGIASTTGLHQVQLRSNL